MLASQSLSDRQSLSARMPEKDESLPSDARWHSVKMSPLASLFPFPANTNHLPRASCRGRMGVTYGGRGDVLGEPGFG